MDEPELEVLLRRRLHARFDGARPSSELRDAVLRPPANGGRMDLPRDLPRVRSSWLLVAAAFAGIAVLGALALTGRYQSIVGTVSHPTPLGSLIAGSPPSSPGASPAAPPSATPAGTMSIPRAFQTATVLPDGRVLVAGGVDAADGSGSSLGVAVDSAELYDPQTGAFSPAGSMTTPRSAHDAILLGDGRVLIVGGDQTITGDAPYHRSAELYDPSTGTFSRTGSMAAARDGFSATLLQDGRVLIAGGFDPHFTVSPGSVLFASAEVYDPATGTFSPTGSMSAGREGHSATLLDDGRVLIVGGEPTQQGHPTAELYDPATGTFSRTGSMVADARAGYDLATRLADGRVLMAGDLGEFGEVWVPGPSDASPEIYDPGTGSFVAIGPMTTPRRGAVVVLLGDGRVLIAGGSNQQDGTGQASIAASAELFDPRTGTFATTGSMSTPRLGATASVLGDGRVLVAGGEQSIDADGLHPVASAELYDPSTGIFSVIAP